MVVIIAKRYTASELQHLININRLDIFYNSTAWRNLSKSVKRQCNNECYICKQHGKCTPAKVVHHVKPLKQFPQLAYSRTYTTDADGTEAIQLMPLCHPCHETIHGRLNNHTTTTQQLTLERW